MQIDGAARVEAATSVFATRLARQYFLSAARLGSHSSGFTPSGLITSRYRGAMCDMRCAILAVWFLVCLGCGDATASSAHNPSQDHGSPYMRVYGATQPPYAFVEFCERMPLECDAGLPQDTRIAGTPEQMAEVDRVNRKINRDIEPATDIVLYGVPDYWTIPTTKGDCEDYALLKRQTLMRAGWPASALLMTVVVDEHHEGHAVLTARTARGDYILDNKTDELRLWHQTPYEFLMRQSYLDPRIWMSLDPEKAMTSVPVGEPRRR
jgi:predicted transglutaminase-like cysteine proteinase